MPTKPGFFPIFSQASIPVEMQIYIHEFNRPTAVSDEMKEEIECVTVFKHLLSLIKRQDELDGKFYQACNLWEKYYENPGSPQPSYQPIDVYPNGEKPVKVEKAIGYYMIGSEVKIDSHAYLVEMDRILSSLEKFSNSDRLMNQLTSKDRQLIYWDRNFISNGGSDFYKSCEFNMTNNDIYHMIRSIIKETVQNHHYPLSDLLPTLDTDGYESSIPVSDDEYSDFEDFEEFY